MSYKLNYRPVDGSAYLRCNQVLIDNTLNKAPVVRYTQERVISDSGSVSKMPAGTIVREFDPDALITVINPETGDPVLSESGEPQTVTQETVMAYVYSAYIDAVTTATGDEEMETQS